MIATSDPFVVREEQRSTRLDENELEALHQTLVRLEQRWMPPLPDAQVWFGYDPLPVALFLPGVRAAAAAVEGRRFLDVGCGIGTKLALMRSLGWEVAGIDQHEPYLAAAAELVPEATLTHADLLDVDWFDADLVFMYRPAVTEELESEVERHVVERMRPGALLFLPTRERTGPWGEPLVPGVWRI